MARTGASSPSGVRTAGLSNHGRQTKIRSCGRRTRRPRGRRPRELLSVEAKRLGSLDRGVLLCNDGRATPGGFMNQENRTRRRAGSRLLGWAERIEGARALDGPAAFLDRLASPLLAPRAVRDALEGQWLGHALHPLATDIPLGCWMSASLLDLVGPSRSEEASRRLIGFGVLTAVPTAAAGVADWIQTEGGAKAGRRGTRCT